MPYRFIINKEFYYFLAGVMRDCLDRVVENKKKMKR